MPWIVKILERFFYESDALRTPNLSQGGWGAWTRTRIPSSKGMCHTIRRLPKNILLSNDPTLLCVFTVWLEIILSEIPKNRQEAALRAAQTILCARAGKKKGGWGRGIFVRLLFLPSLKL